MNEECASRCSGYLRNNIVFQRAWIVVAAPLSRSVPRTYTSCLRSKLKCAQLVLYKKHIMYDLSYKITCRFKKRTVQ